MLRKLMRPGMFAVLTIVALTAWPVAEAQFGGGSFGGGGGGFGGGETGEWNGSLSGNTLIIQQSQSGQSLFGYSEATGEWDKLSTEPHPEHGLTPILSGSVAAVGGKTHLHGFSTDHGKWVTVDVGEPVDVNQIAVHSSRVVYRTDTHVYVFSNTSGKWASVDLTKD